MPNEIYLDSWGNPQVGDPKELDKIKHEKFIKSLRELQTAGLLFVFNGKIISINHNPMGQICRERKTKQQRQDEEAERQERAAYEHMEYLLEAKRKDPNDDFYKGLVDSFSVKKKKSFVDYDGYETEFKGGQPLKHL